MEQLPKTMAEILLRSIQLEEDGFQYYTDAAKKVKNSLGRRMLERLANDEKSHIRRFAEIYNALTNQQIVNVQMEQVAPTTFDEIFNRLKEQLEGALDELKDVGVDDAEVIEMAIDLENTTRFFYQDAAKKANDPKVKKLYEMLAIEEEAHYDVLRKSLEFLNDPSMFFGMGGRQRF